MKLEKTIRIECDDDGVHCGLCEYCTRFRNYWTGTPNIKCGVTDELLATDDDIEFGTGSSYGVIRSDKCIKIFGCKQ